MNIWMIDARTFASHPTGVGMYAFRLLRQMLANPSHPLVGEPLKPEQVILVCDVAISDELKTLQAAGCQIREYGRQVFNSFRVFGYFRFVKRVASQIQPDVFWQPNNLQPFRVNGVSRVIVSMHDIFGLGWSLRYAFWHLYYRWSFARTIRFATELWFNSRQTQHEVEPFVNSQVTRVTYPIVESPARDTVVPYSHSRPYLLYLGNVEKRKGTDLLFAAYEACRSALVDAMPDLIVAGALRNVSIPQQPGIIHLGYVDENTKFSLLKSCLALVVPSRAEGYGMQVAEALTFGTRVIASDLPTFQEVIANCATSTAQLIILHGFHDSSDAQCKVLLKAALKEV